MEWDTATRLLTAAVYATAAGLAIAAFRATPLLERKLAALALGAAAGMWAVWYLALTLIGSTPETRQLWASSSRLLHILTASVIGVAMTQIRRSKIGR